jgi:histidyl-tRNA synthetase
MERLCALYGYRRIQTPGFEDTELFRRTSGAGSDIVQKEMYTFEDRGGRSLTLRPEGTAPICRAYIEHGMHREPQPVKLYTLAPMYRYAAPQRGRFREHNQLSLESIGSADPAVDAEVIQYFDVKDERVRAALQSAPKIGESLCAECEEHFAQVRAHLDAYGVAYTLDPTLVRGLDYYTRTTFEFVGPDESAQASTICGGGRYDYLVEEIGGPPTPGIGFGAGIERLRLSLELEGVSADEPQLDLFLVLEAPERRADLLATMNALRAEGIAVDTDYAGRSVKGQLTHAQKRARAVAIRGTGGWTLRRRGEPDKSGATLKELL